MYTFPHRILRYHQILKWFSDFVSNFEIPIFNELVKVVVKDESMFREGITFTVFKVKVLLRYLWKKIVIIEVFFSYLYLPLHLLSTLYLWEDKWKGGEEEGGTCFVSHSFRQNLPPLICQSDWMKNRGCRSTACSIIEIIFTNFWDRHFKIFPISFANSMSWYREELWWYIN